MTELKTGARALDGPPSNRMIQGPIKAKGVAPPRKRKRKPKQVGGDYKAPTITVNTA